MPSSSLMVMCDEKPDHSACKAATVFPTHMMCDNKGSCDEIGTGYKPSNELAALIAKVVA
jgi:hypothetical protein